MFYLLNKNENDLIGLFGAARVSYNTKKFELSLNQYAKAFDRSEGMLNNENLRQPGFEGVNWIIAGQLTVEIDRYIEVVFRLLGLSKSIEEIVRIDNMVNGNISRCTCSDSERRSLMIFYDSIMNSSIFVLRDLGVDPDDIDSKIR